MVRGNLVTELPSHDEEIIILTTQFLGCREKINLGCDNFVTSGAWCVCGRPRSRSDMLAATVFSAF